MAEKIIKEHLRCSMLKQAYWIPDHDRRRTSSKFRKNKKFLRDYLELPCWICGRKTSKGNPLEVHHIFEWALWNAIDPAKAATILELIEFYDSQYLLKANGNRNKLVKKLDKLQGMPLEDPDDIRNLVVLCQEHHRLKYTGVHAISFPIWLALGVLKPGFRLVRKEIIDGIKAIKRVDDALADKFGGKN